MKHLTQILTTDTSPVLYGKQFTFTNRPFESYRLDFATGITEQFKGDLTLTNDSEPVCAETTTDNGVLIYTHKTKGYSLEIHIEAGSHRDGTFVRGFWKKDSQECYYDDFEIAKVIVRDGDTETLVLDGGFMGEIKKYLLDSGVWQK